MFEAYTARMDTARRLSGFFVAVLMLGIAIAFPVVSPLLLFVVCVGLLIVWEVLNRRARRNQMLEFARRMHLTYIGDALPRRFPLDRTSSGRTRSISAAMAGDRGGAEVILFDCRLGHGKRAFDRTVVAVRGRPGGFGTARFSPDLETEEVDDWMVVYGDHRLLFVEELELLFSEI
jgi:hypothetical protein